MSSPPTISPATFNYNSLSSVKYMECQKNHAAGMGCTATDGCGEFMAGIDEGSLKCCACNCHRNFHRKILIIHRNDDDDDEITQQQQQKQNSPETGSGEVKKKRFRTKFSVEQKEKMQEFAEKGEWKLQKMEESEVRCFCQEIGIKRKVLKVWMHNNKNHFLAKNTNPSS